MKPLDGMDIVTHNHLTKDRFIAAAPQLRVVLTLHVLIFKLTKSVDGVGVGAGTVP